MASTNTTYIIESRLISLNSQYGNQSNSSYLSDITFELPKLLTLDKSITTVELALIHAEIPVSFYNVNYTCNLLKIDATTYTIPVGNYNITSLLTAITTAITATLPSMTFSFSKITGILTINNNTNFTIYNNFTGSIGTLLGMTINSSLTSLSNTLTLPYPVNLLGIKKLSIVSNEIATFNYVSRGNINLLASIPVDQPSYGLVIYENKNQLKHTLHLQDINKIDIQILDEQFNLVNFNNQNWTMLFSIYITRKIADLDFGNNLGVIQSMPPTKNTTEVPFSENDLLME